MSFSVRLTREALEDLQRIDLPLRGVDAIRHEMRILETNPYTCRKAGTNPLERELLIPFGGTGYVALFEIIGEHQVAVSAIRHQREDDYH